MTLYKATIDGDVPLTPDEEAAFHARQEEWEDGAPARAQAEFQSAIEQLIDYEVSTRSYSSPASCASYFNSTNEKWQAEARAFVAWRDEVYEYALGYLAQASENPDAEYDLAEFLTGVPVMHWPE